MSRAREHDGHCGEKAGAGLFQGTSRDQSLEGGLWLLYIRGLSLWGSCALGQAARARARLDSWTKPENLFLVLFTESGPVSIIVPWELLQLLLLLR